MPDLPVQNLADGGTALLIRRVANGWVMSPHHLDPRVYHGEQYTHVATSADDLAQQIRHWAYLLEAKVAGLPPGYAEAGFMPGKPDRLREGFDVA